jgi:hypothetical protein
MYTVNYGNETCYEGDENDVCVGKNRDIGAEKEQRFIF